MRFEHGVPKVALALTLCLAACQTAPQLDDRPRGQFGVLFGGQLQERTRIPFELDPVKQTLALRITLPRPLGAPSPLRWELSKPGALNAKTQSADPDARTTQFGEEQLAAGSQSFEKQFVFKPGDNLGLWNLRVTLGSQLVLDRPFEVYDPRRLPSVPSHRP